jgi:hypothetical protein
MEGFEEVYVWRSGGVGVAAATLELIGAGLSLSANGMTILVGISQLRSMLESARAWAVRNPSKKVAKVSLSVNIQSGARKIKTDFSVTDSTLTNKDVKALEMITQALEELAGEEES